MCLEIFLQVKVWVKLVFQKCLWSFLRNGKLDLWWFCFSDDLIWSDLTVKDGFLVWSTDFFVFPGLVSKCDPLSLSIGKHKVSQSRGRSQEMQHAGPIPSLVVHSSCCLKTEMRWREGSLPVQLMKNLWVQTALSLEYYLQRMLKNPFFKCNLWNTHFKKLKWDNQRQIYKFIIKISHYAQYIWVVSKIILEIVWILCQ